MDDRRPKPLLLPGVFKADLVGVGGGEAGGEAGGEEEAISGRFTLFLGFSGVVGSTHSEERKWMAVGVCSLGWNC